MMTEISGSSFICAFFRSTLSLADLQTQAARSQSLLKSTDERALHAPNELSGRRQSAPLLSEPRPGPMMHAVRARFDAIRREPAEPRVRVEIFCGADGHAV